MGFAQNSQSSLLCTFIWRNSPSFIASQRMEEALRSANHEARLLHEWLEQALGGNDGHMTAAIAQASTSAVLADGAAHGGLDATYALKLSAVDTSTRSPSSTKNDCTTTNPGDDSGPILPPNDGGFGDSCINKTGGSPGGRKKLSANMDVCRTASNTREHMNEIMATPEDAPGTAVDDGGSASAIDRARLLSHLAAEKRIAAMADHLGWAEPIRLKSFASSPPPTPTPSSSSNAHRAAQNRTHLFSTEDHTTERGSFVTRQETAAWKPKLRRQCAGTTPARGGDRALWERRAHSAESTITIPRTDSLQATSLGRVSPCGALDVPRVAVTDDADSSWRSGSKKRRRGRRDEPGGGNQGEGSLSVGHAGLSRSSSFAMGQRRATLERDGRSHTDLELHAVGDGAVPSLPRIHGSRLNRCSRQSTTACKRKCLVVQLGVLRDLSFNPCPTLKQNSAPVSVISASKIWLYP